LARLARRSVIFSLQNNLLNLPLPLNYLLLVMCRWAVYAVSVHLIHLIPHHHSVQHEIFQSNIAVFIARPRFCWSSFKTSSYPWWCSDANEMMLTTTATSLLTRGHKHHNVKCTTLRKIQSFVHHELKCEVIYDSLQLVDELGARRQQHLGAMGAYSCGR
jgi:hypothetical protein